MYICARFSLLGYVVAIFWATLAKWSTYVTLVKGPGILKGCVNEANICAPFAHYLSKMCIKLTQAPLSNWSGYGMTKNGHTFMCMS